MSLGTLRRASLRRVRQAPVPLRRRRTPLPAPPHQRCSPFSPARVASPKRFSAQRRLGNPSVHIRGSDFPRSSFFLLPQAKIETCAGWAADAITCASELVQHPLVLKCCCAMCYSVLFYFHLLLRCKGLQCCIIFIIKDFLTFFVSRANPSLYQNYSNDCIISCGSVLLCSPNRFLPS